MTTPELADRYGRTTSPRAKRLGWVAVGVVAAIGLGYLVWATLVQNINAVSVDDLGYSDIDHNSVTVNFQYTAPRGAEVTCAVEAYDVEHGVVGYKIVRYPASESHGQRQSVIVRTVSEPTNGLAAGCWVS